MSKRLTYAAAILAGTLAVTGCASSEQSAQNVAATSTTTKAPPEDRMYAVALEAGMAWTKQDAAMFAVATCGYFEKGYSVDEVLITRATEHEELIFDAPRLARLVGGSVGAFCPEYAALIEQYEF